MEPKSVITIPRLEIKKAIANFFLDVSLIYEIYVLTRELALMETSALNTSSPCPHGKVLGLDACVAYARNES